MEAINNPGRFTCDEIARIASNSSTPNPRYLLYPFFARDNYISDAQRRILFYARPCNEWAQLIIAARAFAAFKMQTGQRSNGSISHLNIFLHPIFLIIGEFTRENVGFYFIRVAAINSRPVADFVMQTRREAINNNSASRFFPFAIIRFTTQDFEFCLARFA